MKTAYFDCFSGISGNMILGALIDLGVDIDGLRTGLGALRLEGYHVEARRVAKQGISGIYVEVVAQGDEGGRGLADILGLIDQSNLSDDIKEQGKRIFMRLGEAEAKVHHKDLDAVHLHEVGAVDTIIDVVGTLVGLKMLGVEEVSCSPLNLGQGLVECSHGLLPVPAPITAELVKEVPVRATDVGGELTTPTGAAIVTSIAARFGDMPLMKIHGVGYGAGKMDLHVPNLLRVFLGELVGQADGYAAERVTVLETNIDDMNPQLYDHIMERLLRAGALDVFLTPVQMKKNRPGTLLSVVAESEAVGKLVDIILEESSTLGVRFSERQRFSLARSSHSVETSFGKIRVKVAYRGDTIAKVVPEYEDCKKAAEDCGVPISQVYAEVQRNFKELDVPTRG